MKSGKRGIVLTLTGALVISALAGCNASADKADAAAEEDKRIRVQTEAPQINSISIDGDFIGTVESEEQVFVVSKATGDVTATFFEVGDTVNEGDLMYTIDDTAAQLQLKQANAALSTANAQLNVAKAGVNTANASANAAQASVNDNFAKAVTTDKSLQIAIDKADGDFAALEQNIGLLESTINDLNKRIETTEQLVDGAKAFVAVKEAEVAANPGNQTKLDELADARESLSLLEDGLKSLKSTRDQQRVSYDTAVRQKCLLVESADLARAQKSDYDNYTKASIGNGGILTLTQSQAGIVQAQAGVEQSKAGITQAQVAIESAQMQLDNTMVTAPVSGIVTAKNVTRNNMTSTGSVAYTIMSNSNKYVSFFVSEDVMKELSVGQTISIDRNGKVYEAQITENAGVTDAQTGLFKVKALINSEDEIINGVKVKITMATKHAEGVLTLPINAVYHESEKAYVYTIVNGKANKVYVTTGLFDDEKIEIIDGITADDNVITTWSSQLRNGVEVVDGNTSDSASGNIQRTIVVERQDG